MSPDLPQNLAAPSHRRQRSLQGIFWGLGTLLHKQVIYWQDRLGIYSYSHWIESVEKPEISRQWAGEPAPLPKETRACFILQEKHIEIESLFNTLISLQKQHFPWTFVLVLLPNSPLMREGWFLALLNEEPRLRVIQEKSTSGFFSPWVERLDDFPGEWLIPIQKGDEISPYWTEYFSLALNSQPEADIIYWDEDWKNKHGAREDPFFKPDWSPALLFSLPYLETAAFRKSLLSGLFAPQRETEGWIFFATEASRKIHHIPAILQHRSLSTGAQDRNARLARHALHLADYLRQKKAKGLNVEVEKDGLRVRWNTDLPPVSIVIPTKNNLAYIRRCISTLFELTRYPDFEILIMDDHSQDPDVLAYYQQLRVEYANILITENEGPFNYSLVNNRGARLAKNNLLLFLNNDVEIIDSNWLEEMVRWIMQPATGMVGAQLVYPDRTIQHAGIVIGMTGHANHVFSGKHPELCGLFPSPQVYRNVSAVTGACMLVRREVFEQVGGFNEKLGLVFNDVELGLRFNQAGYQVVYTPAAVLIHYEGRSRASYIPPQDIRLGAELLSSVVEAGDPYYNPNLSYAVHWPALRRKNDPDRLGQLKMIARLKG